LHLASCTINLALAQRHVILIKLSILGWILRASGPRLCHDINVSTKGLVHAVVWWMTVGWNLEQSACEMLHHGVNRWECSVLILH
jgi:hypothetical protein